MRTSPILAAELAHRLILPDKMAHFWNHILASPPPLGSLRTFLGQAPVLLVLTMAMWGGNAVAGRLAVGEISPLVLVALRWLVVVAILAPFCWRQVKAEWPLLRPRWRSIVLMGALGFTGFNALFYTAAQSTSAVNLALLQSSIPVLVLLGGVLLFQARISLRAFVGAFVTMVGVVVIASRGDLRVLRSMAFNIGDAWMLLACIFYAGYTLALRTRPAVSGIVFFTAMAIVALLTSLPLLLGEIASGHAQWPTPKGWGVLLYVGIFPSLISQVFFMRGVELIGPGRAGLFVNLVPVFGALFAVVILGEPFALFHAIGLVLVLGGIWLAEHQ